MCSMTVILAISFIVFIFIQYGSDVNWDGDVAADLLYGHLNKYVYWYWYLALGLAIVGLIVMIIILFIRRKTKK